MKKFSSIFVFAAVAMTQLAYAGDGQITVTGTVVSSTCKINGVQQNGSTVSNMSISLGTVAAANFAEAGKVGGVVTGATTQGFNVALTGCPIASTVSLVLDGTGSIDVASRSFRNTATTGAAMNMNAQIVNAEAGVNTVLFPSSGAGISKTTDASGNANFLLGARFLSTGTATAGSFSTVAGFSVVYN